METEVTAKPEVKTVKEDEIKHILEPGEVGAILELVVKDKDGKITEERTLKSRSFVRQFLELLWIHAYPIGRRTNWPVRDTGNVLRSIANYFGTFAANAPIGSTAFGILVGTGTAAPHINDYAMGALIAHGTASGQLQYGGVAFGPPAWDTTTTHFTVTRPFANASGAAVTVREIGLVVQGYVTMTPYNFLIIRDVITGIAVPNGQTLTVNYRLQAAI